MRASLTRHLASSSADVFPARVRGAFAPGAKSVTPSLAQAAKGRAALPGQWTFCAGKIAYVSDEHSSPVASIAAHRARRGHPGPCLSPAGPAPLDPADLQAVGAGADTGSPATAPGEPTQVDGSDILRRLEHATASDGVIARLGEIMASITADDPATAAFWASLASTGPAAGTD